LNEYLKFVIMGSGLVSCGSLGCGRACVCVWGVLIGGVRSFLRRVS
jgi:hypothetical protein